MVPDTGWTPVGAVGSRGKGRQSPMWRQWNVSGTLLLATLAAFVPTAFAQSTSFAIPISLLGEGVDDFKFSMDNGWAILFSLENVYYDEFYTCTPKQAFRVTDVNGDALRPFAIPVSGVPVHAPRHYGFVLFGVFKMAGFGEMEGKKEPPQKSVIFYFLPTIFHLFSDAL